MTVPAAGAPRLRFAPSPTGSLHLGNARTALFNWLLARQAGGSLILRIEDTDVARHREDAEGEILEDLRWLGLDWNEGPDVGGPHAHYRQSERTGLYREASERLMSRGLAYRCFCGEEELRQARETRRARGGAPHYAGTCRGVSAEASEARAAAGEGYAVRFRVAPDPGGGEVVFRDRLRGTVRFELAELSDTIIVRRDGRPTYNFAVVVDDSAMDVTLVVRGDDHLSNTPRQVLMFEALGCPVPEFAHLPMVRGEDGERLRKRHGAVAVAEYRRLGYPPDGLVNALALLGWSPGADRTLVERGELLREFAIDRVSRSAATFDPARLEWICAQHLQRTERRQLEESVARALQAAGLLPADLPDAAAGWIEAATSVLARGLSHLGDVPERAGPLFADGGEPEDEAAREVLQAPGAADVVVRLAELAGRGEPPESAEAWQRIPDEIRRITGTKGKELFRPIRIALTGRLSGPELDLLVPLMVSGAALFPGSISPPAQRATRTAKWLAGDR